MKDKKPLIPVVLFLAAVIGVFAVVQNFRTTSILTDPIDMRKTGQSLTNVTVFYLDVDSLSVVPSTRSVAVRVNQTEFIRDLITFLWESPGSLEAPLPHNTRLLHCFVSSRGEITLDFSAEILELPGGSIQEERLRLSALLRTLSENISPLDKVRLLVEGKSLEQWGSHLRLDQAIALEEWL